MTMTFRRRDPALKVADYSDTDILVLEAEGGSPMYRETVGRDLVAFTDKSGRVVGVTLEYAAQLLRPYLCGEADGCATE